MFMGFPENIKTRNLDGQYPSCRCDISNAHLQRILRSYGFTENKSKELEFPDLSIFKKSKLIYDFIRGYCDGDGSLGIYNNYPSLKISGNIKFLNSIKNLLKLEGGIYKDLRTGDWFGSLDYSGKKAIIIGDLLYKNSTIQLTRKYEVYLKFCRCYGKPLQLLESNIGESCDANPEINSEITKGSESS